MSCLFDSVFALYPERRWSSPHELRIAMCAFMRTDPPLLGPEMKMEQCFQLLAMSSSALECTSVENYLRRMELPSTWGGALEIKALCEMLQVIIVVHSPLFPSPLEFLPESSPLCSSPSYPCTSLTGNNTSTPLIRLHLHYSGNHYTPIKRML